MNEEKLKEVGVLTDTDPSDLTNNNIMRKITLPFFYLIQFVFLATSGVIALIFGVFENVKVTYPYVGFDENYIIGPILVAIVQGGNFRMTYELRKTDKLILKKGTKTKLSSLNVYHVVILNLILSLLLFLSVYFIVAPRSYLPSLSTFPMYGVFIRKEVISKNIFSRSYHV